MNTPGHLGPAAVSAIAGLSFSLIGIALRLGKDRGLPVFHLLAVSTASGAMVFGARALAAGVPLPAAVAWLAVAAGISQYATMHAMRAALHLGPLTPLWAAQALGFIPVTVFAALAFGEALTAWSGAALASAVACVAFSATLGDHRSAPAHLPRGARFAIVYGAVLLAVLLLNSLANMTLKYLSAQGTLEDNLLTRHAPAFLALFYGTILCCFVLDQLVTRRPIVQPAATLGCGLLCAFGSITGLWLMAGCAAYPAAIVFTVSTMASMIGAALVATFWLGEARSVRWHLALGSALLAVVLSQGDTIVRIIRSAW